MSTKDAVGEFRASRRASVTPARADVLAFDLGAAPALVAPVLIVR